MRHFAPGLLAAAVAAATVGVVLVAAPPRAYQQETVQQAQAKPVEPPIAQQADQQRAASPQQEPAQPQPSDEPQGEPPRLTPQETAAQQPAEQPQGAPAQLAAQEATRPQPAEQQPPEQPQAAPQDSAPQQPAGPQPPEQPQSGQQEAAQQQDAQATIPGPAQNCPGNPNALGTSRVLVIDPAEYSRVGLMQYRESLPLKAKEVVLTFDDGPLPPYSNQVLDILASECVKVTYFLVGEMARAYPAVVRRIFLEGHTIGTHSEDHPLHFGRLPMDKMHREIDDGIANVSAALGDPRGVAPFFRIPGLDRSNVLEGELAARSLVVFSSDTVADDWHSIGPSQVVALALKRLEARGKGILLLHDIHQRTAAALPGLLKELKDKGFHIVQVVPAMPPQIETAGKVRAWTMASAMPEQLTLDARAGNPVWPQSSEIPTPDDIALPAPDASSFEPDAGLNSDNGAVKWPDQPAIKTSSASDEAAEEGKPERDRSAEHERRHGEERHGHVRARRGDRHHADLVSEVKALASLFVPGTSAHR
jgi:peptidoglycan/xylan/chitin deacetylase (PgdA/CDA1 family)